MQYSNSLAINEFEVPNAVPS